MARTDRSRPTRTVSVLSDDADRITEPFVLAVGRRRFLDTHVSDTTERRRRANRGDRRAVRVQLRRDPDFVELRQPRGRAIRDAR